MAKQPSEAPGPKTSSTANTADQAQCAFDFGDSHQGVPELVSQHDLWVTNPRAAVRQWMAESDKKYTERSITQYIAMVGAVCDHWAEVGKGASILTAGVAELEQFLSKPNARGQISSDGTKRRYLGLLQSVFDHLVEAGLRNNNPARQLLQMPVNSMVERAEPIFLLPEQMRQLQDLLLTGQTSDWLTLRNRALIGAFAGAGITASEAQSLSLENVAMHRAEITLYIDHRAPHKRRSAPLDSWATQLMLDWLTQRRAIAPKLNLLGTGGPLFPASLKADDQAVGSAPLSLRPARSLSDTEIYMVVSEVLAKISTTAAQLGPQTLRNSYATTKLIDGAKDAKLMTDLGLETTFTLDVLRKQLVDKGLIKPKKRD